MVRTFAVGVFEFSLISICCSAAMAQFKVDECWSNVFNGEDNGSIEDDRASGIVMDSSGNVYVCGASTEQVDSNLFSPRYTTQKLNSDGSPVWDNFWRPGGGTFASAANVIALNSQDHVIVAGAAFGSDDWAVVQYDPVGNTEWDHVYMANSTFLTNPTGMFVDSDDNVYVTGDVGSFLNPDFGAIVKLNAAGAEQWVAEYYGQQFNGGAINKIVVDDAGNVYAAGIAVVNGFAGQAALVKFDQQGQLLWERTDGSFFQVAVDIFEDLVFDNDGNIVLVGTFGLNTAKGPNIAIAKYDSQGNEIWTEQWDGSFGSDLGVSVKVDSNNDILIAGTTAINFDDRDTVIAKFDPDGNLVWDATIAGEGLGFDAPRDLEVDESNQVFFTGTEEPFLGVDFQVTGCLDPLGNVLWKTLYGGTDQCCSSGVGLAVGPMGQVVTVGTSFHSGDDANIVTICYQPTPSALLGDVNQDSLINLLDVQPFVDLLSGGGFQSEADVNQDGHLNLLDVAGFVELIAG